MIGYAKIGTFATNITSLLIVGNLVKSKNELKWFRTFTILKAATIIIALANFYFFEATKSLFILVFILIQDIFHKFSTNLWAIARKTFHNNVIEEEVKNTVLMIFDSVNSLGGKWPVTIVYMMSDFVRFEWFVGFSLCYCAYLYFVQGKKLESLQKSAKT